MDTVDIVQVLEDTVYNHSRYVDRCKVALKRASQGKASIKLDEGFTNLVKLSKSLEEILKLVGSSLLSGNVSIEEAESIAVMAFYIYEVSVEEERALWLRYSQIFSATQQTEGIDVHLMRLDRLKKMAEKVLESAEKVKSSSTS